LRLTILDEQSFAGYGPTWNALLEESSCRSFFLKWEWMYSYWRTLERDNARLVVVLCHDGPELIGIAPLYAYDSKVMEVPVTKLAFLGDGVAGDYMDFIARPGEEARCCRNVLRFLRESPPIRYDVIELDAVCPDAHLFRHVAGDGSGDVETLVDFRFGCPRARLGSTYAQYLQRLSASTRYAVGRRERRLERRYGRVDVWNVDLHRHAGLLDVLFELHRARWETARPGESTFHSAYRMRFNRELLGRLAPGDGYFSLVSIGGRPVSIVYVFAHKREAFFYQNGWAPELGAYGVGLVGVQNALRHAAATGFESFDFLRGDEDYKYKFCDDVRRAHVIRIFGRGVRARALARIHSLKQAVKRKLGERRGAVPAATAHAGLAAEARFG